MKVALYISAGVSPKNLAHEAEIAPFVTGAPDVILWGIRVFKLASPIPANRDDTHNYVEVFAYAIP